MIARIPRERDVPGDDGRPAFPGVLQVWTETLRNDRLSALLRAGYGTMRAVWVKAVWVKIAEAYRGAGMLRADVPAGRLARAMIAVAQDFIAQQALFGEAGVEVLRGGLNALMTMDAQRGS